MFDEKAQLHTLEAMAAATMMLLVIIYAIDATSMTPLTSSTANVHVETELQLFGQDILSALDHADPGYNSELKNVITSWKGDQYIWNGKNYINSQNCSLNPVNATLVDILNKTLVRNGIAHNIELTFLDPVDNSTPTLKSKQMIYNGEPSNNAVIISRKIVLQDTNLDLNSTEEGEYEYEGCEDEDLYTTRPIKDIDSSNLYNIVDIKLILWRM